MAFMFLLGKSALLYERVNDLEYYRRIWKEISEKDSELLGWGSMSILISNFL